MAHLGGAIAANAQQVGGVHLHEQVPNQQDLQHTQRREHGLLVGLELRACPDPRQCHGSKDAEQQDHQGAASLLGWAGALIVHVSIVAHGVFAGAKRCLC